MDFDQMISLIRAIDLRLALAEANKRPAAKPPAQKRTGARRGALRGRAALRAHDNPPTAA